ncbi:MAG: transposase, partial [Cyanobacteria bacterium P01_F01_bin.53]
MLARDYRVLTKDYSTQRAPKLADSVTEWFDDPTQPGRQVGLVTTSSTDDYCRPVIRIAVRCRKNNGHWAIGVLVTNLPPDEVATLMNIEF